MKRALSEENTSDDSSPVWADVLTDIILSILTMKNTRLSRPVLVSIYKFVSPNITRIGLQRLIDGILPSKESKLFDESDSSDSEEEEEDEEEKEGEGSEDNEESSESDSDVEDQIDDNAEVDVKFRNDVMSALGSAAQQSDDEVYIDVILVLHVYTVSLFRSQLI